MTSTSNSGILYKELSHQLIGIAFTVHNQLGPGFSEKIYETAFSCELAEQKIPFDKQMLIEVNYKTTVVGTYRLDLVVDRKIILELKAISQINDLQKGQLVSYLKASGLSVGYVINFGAARVQYARIINTPNTPPLILNRRLDLKQYLDQDF